MLVSMSEIFRGVEYFEYVNSQYSDSLRFIRKEGLFIWRSVHCHGGVDGTCQCNSHETYCDRDLSVEEGLAKLREWGLTIQEDVNWEDVKERISWALFNTEVIPPQLFGIAGILKIGLKD
jgi:hypothetical protein